MTYGSPVALKSSLGEGYTAIVSFDSQTAFEKSGADVLDRIRTVAPETRMSPSPPHRAFYHLHSKDTSEVERILQLLEEQGPELGVARYDIQGTSIEDIFLNLIRIQRRRWMKARWIPLLKKRLRRHLRRRARA